MSDALARALERSRQARQARAETIAARVGVGVSSARQIAGRFAPGDRVFDRVSGREGVVISASRENIVLPPPRRRNGGNRVDSLT